MSARRPRDGGHRGLAAAVLTARGISGGLFIAFLYCVVPPGQWLAGVAAGVSVAWACFYALLGVCVATVITVAFVVVQVRRGKL